MPNIEPEIQVACAVIWCEGQILIAQRRQKQHQGGLWEFPGGKFEPNESPTACLRRELTEELGIDPIESRFVCQIPWHYGDRRVRLWVYEVLSFTGSVEAREGQPLAWVSPSKLATHQFPAANQAIVGAVGLPRLARFLGEGVDDWVNWAQQSHQRTLIYFRNAAPSDRLERAISVSLEAGHAVILTVDQWPCFQAGCGLHLRHRDPIDAAWRIREEGSPVWPVTAGLRTHADFEKRKSWRPDAWFVSPVKATPTHADMSPLGWRGFQQLASAVGAPCYALGGVNPADLPRAIEAMGFGVAGIRGF